MAKREESLNLPSREYMAILYDKDNIRFYKYVEGKLSKSPAVLKNFNDLYQWPPSNETSIRTLLRLRCGIT